jgi:hypothetical protein
LFSEKFQVLTPFFAEVPTGGRGAGGRDDIDGGADGAGGDAASADSDGVGRAEAGVEGDGEAAAVGTAAPSRETHSNPAVANRSRQAPKAIHQ